MSIPYGHLCRSNLFYVHDGRVARMLVEGIHLHLAQVQVSRPPANRRIFMYLLFRYDRRRFDYAVLLQVLFQGRFDDLLNARGDAGRVRV